MFVVAGISVIILLSAIAWRITQSPREVTAFAPTNSGGSSDSTQNVGAFQPLSSYAITAPGAGGDTATSPDSLSQLGDMVLGQLVNAYVGLQNAGLYSTSTAEAAARDALPLLDTNVQYKAYMSRDLHTDSDTSYARMLTYRDDLRTSLAPLLKNTDAEYEIFAGYVQTKDPSYLATLSTAAQNYRDAASLTAQIIVPADAVPYHVAILNAMAGFAAVLDAMVLQADDPFAVAGLLQTYNQAEADMFTSFNALTIYYKSKSQ